MRVWSGRGREEGQDGRSMARAGLWMCEADLDSGFDHCGIGFAPG